MIKNNTYQSRIINIIVMHKEKHHNHKPTSQKKKTNIGNIGFVDRN